MLKDVVITIKALQGCDTDEVDRVDFVTDGYYMMEDGVACLSYEESAVTGLEGTRTSLMISDRQVVVDRDGMITSRMVFREGEKNSFLYNTPYGSATMGMDTKKIRQSFDEHGGKMSIDYVINMEHAVFSRNQFHVSVSPRESIGGDRIGS